MGRYGEEEEEEEEGIEIILPEIVPELFTSNEAWICITEFTRFGEFSAATDRPLWCIVLLQMQQMVQ